MEATDQSANPVSGARLIFGRFYAKRGACARA